MVLGKKVGISQDYNIQLTWSLSDRCNLNCVYCCNVYPDKKHAACEQIDIPALLKALEQTGKIFRIHFVGGEPFLVPNIVEACAKITERHYVSFSTNLISPRVKEFADKIGPGRVVRIVAAAHLEELEKHRLLDIYVRHVLMLKEKGFNVRTVVVAYPSLKEEAPRYRQLFKARGVELNFVPFVGRYGNKFYPFFYSDEELGTFGLEDRVAMRRYYYRHGSVCNAGYNMAFCDSKGDIYTCNTIKIKIGNIYNGEGINFSKNLIICPFRFCSCPFPEIDPPLFKKALNECAGRKKIYPWQAYFLFILKEIERHIGLAGIFLRRRHPKIYFAYKKFHGE